MTDWNPRAPLQCPHCGAVAAYPTAEGYVCEECGHIMTWSFIKVMKMRSTNPQDKEDLRKSSWKQIPPFDDEVVIDFQI